VAENIGYMKEHRLFRFIILSGLFHALILFLFAQQNTFSVLGFLQPAPKPEQRQIAFEIVESPEDSRSDVPPENTNLLSDKQSLARDRNPDALSGSDVPFSEGIHEMKSLEGQNAESATTRGEESSESRMMVRSISSDALRSGKASEFSREVLLGQKSAASAPKQSVYDQRTSSVNDLGGLSFNTYAWDFAPYLLELKNRIQKNVYPPPAFTHLGFGGRNIVRFRIYPDGRLEALQVLGFEGEQALVETSKKAIQLSAPFRPLPKTFPEEYLEVTGSFVYMGLRNR
jgi:hypothetical protein